MDSSSSKIVLAASSVFQEVYTVDDKLLSLPRLILKLEHMFIFGSLPRPPDNDLINGFWINLGSMNKIRIQLQDVSDDFSGYALRQGELRSEPFRQTHTYGDDVHGLDLMAIFVIYVTGLPAVCHNAARALQSSSHVAVHMRRPLCSFARVLLMHMTLFKLLLVQVLMTIVSTSSPQFVILHCCNLLLQKLLKFEKMSSVIYLEQSRIHSALRQWNVVTFDVSYGLLLRQSTLFLHVRCFFTYLFLVWSQAFFCFCHVCDCEVLHCWLDGCGFLLRHRWWVSQKKPILAENQVLSKRLTLDYVFSIRIVVARFGWLRSILDLLHCSLPRPPEVLCDSL